MTKGVVFAALGLLAACADEKKAEPAARVTLRRVTGTTFELLPADNQQLHCLAFTISGNGVIRQLTMSRENVSFACPAGKPVGGHPFRVPIEEGTVKVHVLFSSQRLNAATVAQQLLDLRERPKISSMDLRLPGDAAIETIAFTPEVEPAPVMGALLGEADAGL